MSQNRNLFRMIDKLIDTMAVLSALLIMLLLLGISVNVIVRYTLNREILGLIEISEYALLYILFLGTPWLLKVDGHIRVDLLIKKLSPRFQLILEIVNNFMGLIVSLILIVYGSITTWEAFIRGAVSPTILEFPKYIVLIIIPIGSLFLAIQFIRRILNLKNSRTVINSEVM